MEQLDPRSIGAPDLSYAESSPVRLVRKGEMTMRELAERAGLARSMVEDVERGTRRASPGTLQRLSEALGVRLGDLMEAYHRWRCTLPVEYLTPDERRVTGQ